MIFPKIITYFKYLCVTQLFRVYFNLIKDSTFLTTDYLILLLLKGLKRRRYRLLRSFLTKMKNKIRKDHKQLINNGYNLGIPDKASLKINYSEYPVVTIIIPVYNQISITLNCINSIVTNTSNEINYEILIADDSSTDETDVCIDKIENIKRIINTGEKGFLSNCNNAAKFARGKYLLFLNNDTIVQKGWIEPLIAQAEKNEKIVICGSKLVNYVDELLLLQEAGGIVFEDGQAMNYGRGDFPNHPEYSYNKQVDYVSGACMLVRTDFFKLCNGFDSLYSPAYYEDTDLCYQARQLGFQVWYIAESTVIHLEGMSNGKSTESGLKQYQITNRIKFAEKWNKVLIEERKQEKNIFLLRDRSQSGKVVLVIDIDIPSFDTNAGNRSTDQYINLLLSAGFTVKLIALNTSGVKELKNYQQHGIEVISGRIAKNHWKRWIKLYSKNINYILINRPDVAKRVMPFLRKHCTAKLFYFGHDLHYLRYKRDFDLSGNRISLSNSKKYMSIEKKILLKSDFSFYFSNEEVDNIKSKLKVVNVSTIPLFYFNTTIDVDYHSDNRKGLLFVGGFSHKPNHDAMIYFLQNHFDEVLKEIPDVQLYIVGSGVSKELLAYQSKHIIFTGYVSDEIIRQLYSSARLVIAPLRFGAGVKGKIVEAMYYGVPVITTRIGAEGIKKSDSILSIVDDFHNFGRKLIDLYNDFALLNQLSRNGLDSIKEDFSEEAAKKLFLSHFVDTGNV